MELMLATFNFIRILKAEDRDRFCWPAGPSPLKSGDAVRHCPDSSAMLLDRTGRVAARCSLWWTETPQHGDDRLGAVGHYAAALPEAAAQILEWATGHLTAQGCTLAVGPMDGNTWRRYRFLTERGDEPLYFLEPDNPDDWPGHFTNNGFEPLAHYYSALNTDLSSEDPRLLDVARRTADAGITLRTLDLGHFEDELRSIFQLSLDSFGQNFLYTPITLQEFLAQYQPIQPYVNQELVLIAEQQGKPIGYVFGIPDLLQARRGQRIDTVIVKTLAVHPEHGGRGLGGLLIARCHDAARKIGCTRAIHALMHETNKSRRISSHTAKPFRRYTLFAKRLGCAP
jgi:GNAT superfamily N-acetyltransferase